MRTSLKYIALLGLFFCSLTSCNENNIPQLEIYLGIKADEVDIFGERGVFTGLLLGKDGGAGFDALYGGYHNNCVDKDAHKNRESHFWTSSSTREGEPIIRVITSASGCIARIGTI